MPLRNYKLLIFGCQVFRFPQFTGFQPHGFSQNHTIFNFKNSFAAAFADMDVNGTVIVAIEEKPESMLDEYGRHDGNKTHVPFAVQTKSG